MTKRGARCIAIVFVSACLARASAQDPKCVEHCRVLTLARCGAWSFSRDIPETRYEVAKRSARIALASQCAVDAKGCCTLPTDTLDARHAFDETMMTFGWEHAQLPSCGAFFVADGELLTSRHCIEFLAKAPDPDEYVVLRHDDPTDPAWTFCGAREIMAFPGGSPDGEDLLRVAVGADLELGERIPTCERSDAEPPRAAFALHHPIGVALVHDEVTYDFDGTVTRAAMDYGEYSSGGAVLASTENGDDVCLVGLVRREKSAEMGHFGVGSGAVAETQWSCGARRGRGDENNTRYPTQTPAPEPTPTGDTTVAASGECTNRYHPDDMCVGTIAFNVELAVPSTPAS